MWLFLDAPKSIGCGKWRVFIGIPKIWSFFFAWRNGAPVSFPPASSKMHSTSVKEQLSPLACQTMQISSDRFQQQWGVKLWKIMLKTDWYQQYVIHYHTSMIWFLSNKMISRYYQHYSTMSFSDCFRLGVKNMSKDTKTYNKVGTNHK